VLTNNTIAELGDLEPLKELKRVKYLSLLGNPVREKKWYREWLVWRIPGLRVLDFQRIRDKVRSPAPPYAISEFDELTPAFDLDRSSTIVGA